MSFKAIAGVRIEDLDATEIKSRIKDFLSVRGGARIYTPNSLILYKTSKDARLAQLLNSGDLLLPDGIGISVVRCLRGEGVRGRITGIDTAEWILRYAEKKGLSVYLLGGKSGVAERAAERLKKTLPKLKISGTHHGYIQKRQQNAAVIEEIRRTRADIVFVCMGFPRQEAWISSCSRALPNVRLFMGLGGSLDVWSGKLRRAPLPFRALCLEWLWRAICEPKRAAELISIPLFLLSER